MKENLKNGWSATRNVRHRLDYETRAIARSLITFGKDFKKGFDSASKKKDS